MVWFETCVCRIVMMCLESSITPDILPWLPKQLTVKRAIAQKKRKKTQNKSKQNKTKRNQHLEYAQYIEKNTKQNKINQAKPKQNQNKAQ